MSLPTPISVTKSPCPAEESNLIKEERVSCLLRQEVEIIVVLLGQDATDSVPLPSGWDASLSQPVYSIVTTSPALGVTPVPCSCVVLVTPILVDILVETERG